MAQTTIAATLSLDSSQAQTDVKTFKQQLSEANAELVSVQEQFGASSKEATEAAARVTELRNVIGTTADTTKTLKSQFQEAVKALEQIKIEFGAFSPEAEAAAANVAELRDKIEASGTSVKSFRQQLREATQDLILIQEEFGQTSEEATIAAKKVADLRDRMDDAKQIAEAFNPDAKFQALTKATQGAIGGITALTGAMALFGSESQDVQKAILKVQGALALSQGLSQIGELGKSFAILKVVAVDAFNSIKAAIGSTGIGLIVVALGAIVAYWDDIKESVGLVTAEQEKSLELSKQSYQVEKDKLDIIAAQTNLYKEQGISQQQILEMQKKQAENVEFSAKLQLANAKAIYDAQIKNSESAFGSFGNAIFGVTDERKKKAQDDAQALLDPFIKAYADAKNAVAGYNLDILKNQSDFQLKLFNLNHAAAEAGITDQFMLAQMKLKDQLHNDQEQAKLEYTNAQERQQVLSALQAKYDADSAALTKSHERQLANDLRKIRFDAFVASISDQTVLQELQLKQQLDSDIRQANLEISNVKDRNEKIAALQLAYDAKLNALRQKNLLDFQNRYTQAVVQAAVNREQQEEAELDQTLQNFEDVNQKKINGEKQFALLRKEIGDMHLDQAGQQAAQELDALEKWYSDRLGLVKDNEDAILALNKEYERQKTLITENENNQRLAIVSSTLGQAAQLFSQYTLAGKVLAIAQTTIDTYQSAVSSYKSLAGIPIVGPALGLAAAAVAVATGLANVKKIVSVQVPGASGGNGSVPSISASAPLQATPQVSQTQLPQQQINQIGNAAQPIKAFVVESDITGSQERVERLNRAARLGG